MEGFTVYRLPCVVELILDFNILLNMRATLKKIKPDVVHIHEPIQGGSALAALHKDLGFKLVVDQHAYSTTFDETDTSLKNKIAHFQFMLLRRPIANYALNRADAITAVLEKVKQFTVKVHEIPPQRVEIVPLGMDEKLFKFDEASRKKIRKELGITDKTVLILTAGRIDRAKKFDKLIKAFNKLKNQVRTRLLIIGTGDDEYERELRQLVSNLNLDDRITFIKFVNKSKLAAYYSAADIGFWNKATVTLIEAMGCKLPLVIPNQPTMIAYVDNKNGLLFKDGDVDSLTEKFLALATNAKRRAEMGERAIELVEKKYSYKVTAKKMLKIYQRCLNE
jgi:glycosyltransferase involved in cell wall biosynthesis